MFKIAVIDDDEFWCLAIHRFFRKEFEVSTFTDTSHFLKSSDHYDLIIVDFTILPLHESDPIQNGCELIQHIKSTFNRPPIAVLMSGFVNHNDLSDNHKLCPVADAFLPKDLGLTATLQAVKELLNK